MEIKLGIYRHYKGNEYEILGTAKHSETLEELVVYRKLYSDHSLWVRPLEMFTEYVPDTNTLRFEFLREK